MPTKKFRDLTSKLTPEAKARVAAHVAKTIARMRARRSPGAMRIPLRRPPTHPGEMLLEEFLKPAKMTQAAAAAKMGVSLSRLRRIVRGTQSVTTDTAVRLSRLTHTSPEMWLNLQDAWDQYDARQATRRRERSRR